MTGTRLEGRTAPLQLSAVIGHRGAAASAPENTLAGLRRAKALGCAWVEFDVRLTGDGVPILCHDAHLDRTTSGSGLVSGTSLAAIPRSVLFRVVPRGWAEMAYRLGCTTIGADHRRLQPRRIAAVRAAGYRLATYTVNDPFRANLLFEWGVSSVFSDAPDIIRPHVNRSDVIRSVSAGHHPDLARQGANR
jgi:glycerophosphoryl diester phosphodiesterase